MMQRQAEDGGQYERRLEAVHREVTVLRKQVQGKEEMIGQQVQEVEQYREKCFNLEGELSRRLEEREGLEGEIRRIQAMYEELYLQKGADSTLKIEVE